MTYRKTCKHCFVADWVKSHTRKVFRFIRLSEVLKPAYTGRIVHLREYKY